MTSSMQTGERRWGSSRRGAMTVLGKVAVPKPINLPSQRLESHGQDRDVEIVPKGTLGWGSKPSSSTSSAWGTVQSPNTDGSTGSPSHLSGRPSSSGNGTRPSTAGSDITHERGSSAWGPSSRPSSASGSLASNQQSLISLRPHSADTRPGSSQLSRFAESVSENATAWGAGATGNSGTTPSSKNDRFPLTSGDFPTLGLDKESSGRNIENQDCGPQGRPGSSSGGGPPRKEDFGNSVGDFHLHGDARSGNSNSWRRETQPYGEDGARPSIDKWHAEPQPYMSSSIPPQHFDAWRGPPINNHPGGVWYRGHPGGPPFGPGGFPMEPYPCYRPQVTPPALANTQAVSGGGTGPRGPHPQNGDFYGPHMQDAFVRPGMPMRPGFYPGPVPRDGYYGPPLGYANPNEREISSMGMTVGPNAYNLFTGPNAPDMSNSDMLGGYAPSSKAMTLEQMESGRSHETRARDVRSHESRTHYARTHEARNHDAHPREARTHDVHPHGRHEKVLLKQSDCWEDQDEQKQQKNISSHSSRSGEDDRKRLSSTERSWNMDHNRDGRVDGRKVAHGGGAPWELNVQRELPVKPKSPAIIGSSKGDVNSLRRLDTEELGAPQLPEVSAAPINPTSLMQKIEGLNAKVRVTDGLQDVEFPSGREEQKNIMHTGESKKNTHGKGADSGLISHETHKNHISPSDRTGDSAVASETASFRKSNRSMHVRADHHSRGRLGTKEDDGRHERSRFTNLAAGSTIDIGNSASHGQDRPTVEAIIEGVESSSMHPRDKVEGELSASAADLSDTQLQRATMLELAKLRLQQREKEEEERARDQKAKALAKLEELNRRTQGEESAQKMENASSAPDQNKQTTVAAGNAKVSVSVLGPKPNSGVLGGENKPDSVEKSSVSTSEGLLETPKIVKAEYVSVQEQSKNLHVKSDVSHHGSSPQIYDKVVPKQKEQIYDKGVPQQKGTSHAQKQNLTSEKKSGDKLKSSPVASNTTVYFGGVAVEISSTGDSGSLFSTAVMTETSVQQKNNLGGKNKPKLEETSANVASASSLSEDKSKLPESTAQKFDVESVQSRTLTDAVNTPSVQLNTDSKNANQSMEQRAMSPNEDAHGRVNNHRKSLQSKRIPKNPTANRSTEKLHGTDSVVWAPVRPQNKAEGSDEVVQKIIADDPSLSIKNDQQVQRNKRTEMERYIPKHLAQEVAHNSRQVSVLPSSQDVKVRKSSLPKEDTVVGSEVGVMDIDSSQNYSTTTGKVISSMESKDGDGKLSKPGKAYEPWRKRGPAESTGSFHLDHGKNLIKLTEHPGSQGPDVISGKEQSQYADDDWNTPETPIAPAPALVVNDLGGAASREKRQPFRGQKSAGYTRDSDDKRINGGDGGKRSSQSPAVESHQIETTAIPKERRVVGDQSVSHWQPKAHVPATNQRGSRSSGTQVPSQSETEYAVTQEHRHEKSLPQETEHQEPRRERKSTSQKGRLGRLGESSALSNSDNQHEQHVQTGFHKTASQNSRFLGGQDTHKDWGGPGKDYRQNSASVNRERYRHNNRQYEYQPVGPQNNSKVNAQEPQRDGSQNPRSRSKERNPSQSRRGAGHFYGRNSGSIQVDANDK